MSPVSRTVLHVLKQSVSGTSLFLLFSEDGHQIAHEWLAAKKGGGEGWGWGEIREEERDKFSSLRTPPYELILTGTLLLSPSPSLCSKRMSPGKENRKIFTNTQNNKSQNFKFVKCWETSHSTLRYYHIGTLWYFTCHRTLPSTVELQ